MAVIRVKRAASLTTPELKSGEIGLIGDNLYFGKFDNGETAATATKIANQSGNNTFSGENVFSIPGDATTKSVSFKNSGGTEQYFVKDGHLSTAKTSFEANHLVNKNYVDGVVQGLDIKESVKILWDYGTNTGAPNYGLTGLASKNDYTPVDGDRILVLKLDGVAYKSNGIWIAHSGPWTRALDFAVDSNPEGSFVFVEQGANYGNTGWVEIEAGPVGTGDIIFTQFSGTGTFKADETSLEIYNGDTFRIKNKGVSFTKIQDIATKTILGRAIDGSGSASALSMLDIRDMIGLSTLVNAGLLKTLSNNDTHYMDGKGNWTVPYPSGQLQDLGDYASPMVWSGDMLENAILNYQPTADESTLQKVANVFSIKNNGVTLGKMQKILNGRLLGRQVGTIGGTGDVEVLTAEMGRLVIGLNLVENTALSTWNGSGNLTTLGTIETGQWEGNAILASYGGTGKTSYTANSLLYASSALTIGEIETNGTVTKMFLMNHSDGAPAWSQINLADVAGTLSANKGGTGLSTFAQGSLLYADAIGSWSQRTIGTNGQVLTSSGGFPIWSDLPAYPTSFNLTDDILDGSANKYAPYTTRASGRFYTHATNEAISTVKTLRYDGVFNATEFIGLVDGGVWS